MVRKLILLLFLYTINSAQTGILTGSVTENNEPLPGVNILVINTTIGNVSDENGYYKITRIPVGKQSIRFSAVGYRSKTIDVEIKENKTLELNVELNSEAIEVGEIEVVDERIQEQSDTRSSLIDLEPGKARVLPGAVTDVFRTLQALPGVLAPNDFSSQLIIRGSGPDQNLIVMDDVEVFNPYRLYGVISMFNPEAVSDINLVTGGFPATYGDRLSAVLDVTNRQGSRTKNLTGTLNASIVSANLVLEGKNPFDIPGSWLINSRRTYYDLIIEPFVKDAGLVEDNVTFPNFYDIQTKLAFGPFNGHKFLLNGIYSRDGVNLVSSEERENPDSVGVFDDTKNDLASFAWHYTPSQNTLNKLIFSWYRNAGDTEFDAKFIDPSLDRDRFEDELPDTLAPYLVGFGFNSKYNFRKYTIDNKFLHIWNNNNELELGAGVDFMLTRFDVDFTLSEEFKAFFESNPNIRAVFDDLSDIKEYNRYRLYAQNKFTLGERIFFQPGIRYDYYNILRKGYAAPRVSLSFALNDLTTIRTVWGIYYQSPGYEKLRDANQFLDFSKQYTDDLEAEKSTHYILSIERWLNSEWKAKLEGYYKDFDDLIIQKQVTGTNYFTEPIPGRDPRFRNSWTRPVPIQGDSLTQIPVNQSNGEAYGFEILIEKRNITGNDKLSGWISYSLAWAERYEYNRTIPFRFDQRHTINVVLDYELNDWLDLGVRFQYGSGFPYTDAVGIQPRIIMQDTDGDNEADTPIIATRGESDRVIYDVNFGGIENRFNARRPDYHRLDLRLSAAADYWDLDWTFYLDVINVYNRTNVIGYDYNVTEDLQLEREVNAMFPIVPTLGFNVRF